MRYLLLGIAIGIAIGVAACLILFRLPGVTSPYWAGIFGVIIGGIITIMGNLIDRIFRMIEQKRAAEGQFKRDAIDKSIQLVELKKKYSQKIKELMEEFEQVYKKLRGVIFEKPGEENK